MTSSSSHKNGDAFSPEAQKYFCGLRRARIWCNPPYGPGQIETWVGFCRGLAVSGVAETLAMLLPATLETDWAKDLFAFQETHEIRLASRRISFFLNGVRTRSPKTGSIIAVLHNHPRANTDVPDISYWSVPCDAKSYITIDWETISQ